MTLPVAHRDAFVWGNNSYGQLGLGYESRDSSQNPTKLNINNIPWTQIASGVWHTVALSTKGEVYSWGRGDVGQIGHGDWENRNVPTKVEGLSGEVVIKVACGLYHTASLTAGGKVFTW